MRLIVAVVVTGQLANVLGWYALSSPWRGLTAYLQGVGPWFLLPVGTLSLAVPFLFAPRRWWAPTALVAAPVFAVASTLINLFYLHSASLAAQLMSVVGAFFAGYHFRRRAAYIALVIGVVSHAILVWGVLSSEVAIGDMIFMDLFLTTMVVALVHVRDEQERSHRDLHRQATTDSMTGLATRSVLHEQLTAEIAAGHPTALVLVDLDRFKQINDTYGHPAGDAALVEIARRMRVLGHESHLLARLGGDEFAVLLRGQSQTQAAEWAEALGQAVADHPLIWVEPGADTSAQVEIMLSVSVGCAASTGQGDAELVYAAADRAMYESKRIHRSQMVPVQGTVRKQPPHSRRSVRDT